MPSVSVDDFTEIVAISRLPVAGQAPKIAQIYHGWPSGRGKSAGNSHANAADKATRLPELTAAEKALSGEEQIALARQRGDWQRYIDRQSSQLAFQILRAHPDEVAELIHLDLRSQNGEFKWRGLSYLWKLLPALANEPDEDQSLSNPFSARWTATFYDDVALIFQKDFRSPPPTSMNFFYSGVLFERTFTEGALIKIGDPRAIALFIADNPSRPDWHYWSISWLAPRAPNDAALRSLEKLLVSADAESRYRALFALPAANDAARVALPALLEDTENKTRELAVSKAFELNGPEFEKLEIPLKNLLTHASAKVRLDAAVGFAKRGDAIAAPALLRQHC